MGNDNSKINEQYVTPNDNNKELLSKDVIAEEIDENVDIKRKSSNQADEEKTPKGSTPFMDDNESLNDYSKIFSEKNLANPLQTNILDEKKDIKGLLTYVHDYDVKRLSDRNLLYQKGNFKILENSNDLFIIDSNYINGYIFRSKYTINKQILLSHNLGRSSKVEEFEDLNNNFLSKIIKKIEDNNEIISKNLQRINNASIKIED